jgi:hypothetical protein
MRPSRRMKADGGEGCGAAAATSEGSGASQKDGGCAGQERSIGRRRYGRVAHAPNACARSRLVVRQCAGAAAECGARVGSTAPASCMPPWSEIVQVAS